MSIVPRSTVDAAELLDQPAQAVRERDAAGMDADQCDAAEIGVALDDLVSDPLKGAPERVCVEKNPPLGGCVCSCQLDSFSASLDRVKGR